MNRLENFQNWVESLPELLQYISLIILGAIPYVESYGSAFVGAASGINPTVAILFAILGNFVSVLLLVLLAEKINNRFGKEKNELSPKRQKFNKNFEKYGVIGTSMLAWMILPSQITSILMVSVAKVSKAKVVLWMTVSMITWAIIFGIAAFFLFQ